MENELPAQGNIRLNAAVDAIIVNYNAGELLARSVLSVLGQGADVHVTVIDNASSDASVETLLAAVPESGNFKLIKSQENPGLATAVNRVARAIRASHTPTPRLADFLLILNPDCVMQDGALEALLRALQDSPRAALAAPLVTDFEGETLRGTLRRFPDPWKSFLSFSGLWRLGRRFPRFEGVDQSGCLPAEITKAEAVSGACMLIRKEAFYELGGMDEAYGLHCEDLDLMYRLHQAGHGCLFVPQARVCHQQGVSSRSRPLWVHWQKHLGMQRFFCKFQARQYRYPVRWFVIVGIWGRFLLTSPLVLLKR